MLTRSIVPSVAVGILALALTFQTAAAAGQKTADAKKETMLAQAGFKLKTCTNAQQQQKVDTLPRWKVSAVTYKGKLYYVYPTTKKNQVYVGRQAQFDAYKRTLQAHQAATQGARQRAGYVDFTEETAGPQHIKIREFDGFGPMTSGW